jgi:PAS domain S-box-containing protein
MSDGPTPQLAPDPDATRAAAPVPSPDVKGPGRETQERQAALARGEALSADSPYELCAPELPGLAADLLFTLVSENVRDYAIFLMNPNGIIQCWGESARLLKWWTRHQAEGAHLRLLYPDGGAEDGSAESHLEAAAATGEYNGEGHRVRSDASTFWAYVTLTALRNPEGNLVGFVKVTRDFTARRAVEGVLRAQADVAASEERRTEEAGRHKMLVASISHELRGGLNVMLGSVSLLEAALAGDERQRGHLERLKRSGRHLLEIVNDVLDLSRAEAEHLAVKLATRRLGPTIQDVVTDLEPQALAHGVNFVNAVSGGAADLPYVGDESRVRQILINLLTNAIKFTEPGGQITISGGTGETVTAADLPGNGPWIYVRVEDTGRGIPPERLEAIFEPYQQSEVRDQQRGTGLGLSISRQLARLMGGDIAVQSEVGVGSSFTLWLPIASSDPIPR